MAGPYPGYGNPAPQGKADYNMNIARERQHNCAAKSLLYGGDAQDNAPHREGKKSVPHSMGAGAPFATSDDRAPPAGARSAPAPPPVDNKAYTKQVKRDQEGAGKIGAQQFDPDVYRNNRASNAANVSALKSKNWGSGQVMHEDKQQQQQGGPEGHGPGAYASNDSPYAQY